MGFIAFNFQDISFSFLGIVLEGLPFLIIGAIVSGIIAAFLPSDFLTRILPKKKIPSIFAAGLIGTVLPVCECAVVPVVRRLLIKGLPVSCAITYLVATPIVNFLVAISTFLAFRGQSPFYMAGARIALGLVVAIGLGMLFMKTSPEKILRSQVLAEKTDHIAHLSRSGKIRKVIRTSIADFMTVSSFFIIGSFIVSVLNTGVNQNIISPLGSNEVLGTLGLMALAFVLSLCSTSDAFLAATFSHFSAAAKLGFMTLGPIMDIKLMFFYRTMFRKRFILKFAIITVIAVLILSLIAGRLIP